MCKFTGKCDERILCKLSKSEILRLSSIVDVAMETTKTSNFTCQLKSFISIFFTYQVSAYELQPFSCRELANDIHLQTAKTVFSHLKWLTELPLLLFSIEFIFFCNFTTFEKGSLIAVNRSQWLKHIPSSKYIYFSPLSFNFYHSKSAQWQ